MNIKCISVGSSSMLTIGKVYQVVKNALNSYHIKNDQGVVCPYLKENFEKLRCI